MNAEITHTKSPRQSIQVVALYHFADVADPAQLRTSILEHLDRTGIRGTILVAYEGINGTIAGQIEETDKFLEWMQTLPGFEHIQGKFSYAAEPPFRRTRVRLKKEIVSLGVDGVDPTKVVGEYVDPEDWNALISDPEVLVIDTRNTYEVRVGSFTGAIDPNTTNFRSFPDFASEHLDREKNPKIAMYCTGGIRCEKATSFLLDQGFKDVYHLRGGILNYLEKIPEEDSLWEGECFVFDDRVTVDHALRPGTHVLCHACRMPLTVAETEHPDYVAGVSCQYCIAEKTDDDRERFAERQRQMSLAASRGESHIDSKGMR